MTIEWIHSVFEKVWFSGIQMEEKVDAHFKKMNSISQKNFFNFSLFLVNFWRSYSLEFANWRQIVLDSRHLFLWLKWIISQARQSVSQERRNFVNTKLFVLKKQGGRKKLPFFLLLPPSNAIRLIKNVATTAKKVFLSFNSYAHWRLATNTHCGGISFLSKCYFTFSFKIATICLAPKDSQKCSFLRKNKSII